MTVAGTPTQCDCKSLVCHPGSDETMTEVTFLSRTGGPGYPGYLSGECLYRRRRNIQVKDCACARAGRPDACGKCTLPPWLAEFYTDMETV